MCVEYVCMCMCMYLFGCVYVFVCVCVCVRVCLIVYIYKCISFIVFTFLLSALHPLQPISEVR